MSEATDQMALFDLINRLAGLDEFGKPIPGVKPRYPLLRYAFHPANERRDKLETIKAAHMGQRAGVWDIWLPVRNRASVQGRPLFSSPGCAVEMKTEKNYLTAEQEIWRQVLTDEGWVCVVCREWTEAARLLISWVGGNPEEIEGL